MSECTQCRGAKHIRKEGKWVRCDCLKVALLKKRVGHLFDVPPRDHEKVLENRDKDFVFVGRVAEIRPFLSSLIRKVPPSFKIEFFDAMRLIEISFDRDSRYKSFRELIALDLLIIHLEGVPAVNMVTDYVQQVFALRSAEGKPTWLVTEYTGAHLRTKFHQNPGFPDFVGSYPAAKLADLR